MAAAKYTSNLSAVRARHERAVDAALIAAASVIHAAVVERKRRRPYGSGVGFSTGAFGKGRGRQAVAIGKPVTENGVRMIRVGTNYEIEVFWALGHVSLYTRKFERVDDWSPSLIEAGPAARAKFAEIYTAMMRAA